MKITSSISNNRLYKHSLMATNSTTCDFKSVQPLFCRMLMPNSKIDLNLSSFVRLAPLVFPTFGALRSRYLAKYVPFEQIFPQTSTFLSGMPVNTRNYVGKYNAIPQITPFTLFKAVTKAVGTPSEIHAIATTYRNITNAIGDVKEHLSEYRRMPLREYLDRFTMDIKTYLETGIITDDMFTIDATYDDDGNITSRSHFVDTALFNAAVEVVKNSSDVQETALKYGVPYMDGNATDSEILEAQAAYNSADYVDVFQKTESIDSSYMVCYRLNEKGRILRKIFLGLGYQVSKDNSTLCSLLPILAFYKAYFDAFYPKRLLNFADTYCYKFIDTLTLISQVTEGLYLYNGDNYNTSNVAPYPSATSAEINAYQSARNNFTEFINTELVNCYSTHDQDFVSIQTHSVSGNAVNNFDVDDSVSGLSSPLSFRSGTSLMSNLGVNDSASVAQTGIGKYTDGTDSKVATLSPTSITAWSLQMVQRLQNAFNRNSLIGRSVEKYVRSHFNSDVYNELYMSSTSVGSMTCDIDISDITSTAETATTASDGSTIGDFLGSYAGKGIGNTKLDVKFKSDTFGYLIILQWMEVETGYFFGTDPQLHYASRLDMPNSEYDALGYEITPRSCVWSDNGISISRKGTALASSATAIGTNNGFGFIPRMSRFKTSHNIVNGDFSRHSMRNNLSPFYLDRTPICRYIDFGNIKSSTSGDKYVELGFRQLPIASAEWQYNSRYNWLADYNRIFYNSGNTETDEEYKGTDTSDWRLYGIDDNFMLHNVIRWSEINSLKPLSESYDTQIGDDNNSFSVTPA